MKIAVIRLDPDGIGARAGRPAGPRAGGIVTTHPGLRLGWRDDATLDISRAARGAGGFDLALQDAFETLGLLASLDRDCPATLEWFSGVTVAGADARALVARWTATGEPPALSIVRLDLAAADAADMRHRSFGLGAFAGHEIAIACSRADQRAHAARLLARLVRHALMHGPIADGAVFAGGRVRVNARREHGGGAWDVVNIGL